MFAKTQSTTTTAHPPTARAPGFSGIAHFAADKCHIGPRGLGEERADHRSSKKQRQRERAGDCEPGLRRLRIPAITPRMHHAELNTAELAFQANDKLMTTTAVNAAVLATVNVF